MRLPNVGDVFEARYELRRVLGAGGFATVFLAWDPRTRREVVLKVLSPNMDGEYPPTMAARFEREAQVFGSLENPHIVTLYDFGRTGSGLMFMVFENVRGRDLEDLLSRDGALPATVVQHILRQLLEALREAHNSGILHRDIKPGNVLLYQYGDDPHRTKLIDFGIAKDLDPDAPRLTKTGNVVGTLRYMAPEQVFGEPMTPASDIFSLGLVAWEMLTGSPAIVSLTKPEMLQEQASTQPFQLPQQLGIEPLRSTIEKMLSRESSDRFQSAEAVLAALRGDPGSSQVVTPKTLGPPLATTPPSTRLPVLLAAVAASIGLLVMVFAMPDETPVPNASERRARNVSALLQVNEPSAERPVEQPHPAPSTCAEAPPFRGLGKLRSDLVRQGIAAYIPDSYDPDKPAPLVIGYHRGLRDGASFLHDTGLTSEAEKHGWIVLAPESPGTEFWLRDEAFLDMIELAKSALCIDLRKLHLVGDEHGATHAQALSCKYPVSSTTTAFLPAARKVCSPLTRSPLLRLYTKQDKLHPPDGRSCSVFVGHLGSIEGITNRVYDNHLCEPDGTPWEPFSDACEFRDCPVSPVVTCAFDGGHRWPHAERQFITLHECRHDPKTTAPMAEAVAAFINEFGHELSDEELAALDKALALNAGE